MIPEKRFHQLLVQFVRQVLEIFQAVSNPKCCFQVGWDFLVNWVISFVPESSSSIFFVDLVVSAFQCHSSFFVEHAVGKVQPVFLQDHSNVFPFVVFALARDAVQMEIESMGIIAIQGPACFAQTRTQPVFHRHSLTRQIIIVKLSSISQC